MTPLLSEQHVGDWWHFQGCTDGRRFCFPSDRLPVKVSKETEEEYEREQAGTRVSV